MGTVPPAVEQIDVGWLRASVGQKDCAAFSDLAAVRAERLGAGVGLLSDLYRLHLAYRPSGRPGPTTLVVKLPSANADVMNMARKWRLYEREVLFYRELADTVELRVPKPFVAEFDPETHAFVLVLEDMAPAVDGDQVEGLPIGWLREAVDALAGLHASWWNSPQLAAIETTVQPFGEGPWAGAGERTAAAWPLFRPFLDGRASPALVEIGDRLPGAIERILRELARKPRTLCHGDFRADNLMFAKKPRGPDVVVLDWQLALQGRGAVDVSQLLSISVTTKLRREYEAELLRRYHDGLLRAGVADYGYDTLFQDYRLGLLIALFYVIHSASANDLSHPRAEAVYDCAVRRLDALAADHDLVEFVS